MSRICLLASFVVIAIAAGAHAIELKGAVVNADGKPVGGATVWLCQDLKVQETTANDLGLFVFQEAAAQAALVVARKEGHSLGGADVPVPGLGPVAIVLGEPATVEVLVKNELHAPLAGARVSQLALNNLLSVPVELLAEKTSFPRFTSDEEGKISINFAPRGGSIGLVLTHRTMAAVIEPLVRSDDGPHQVHMYPGAKVRGRVSSETQPGVANARIAFYRIDGNDVDNPLVVTADPEGYYHAIVRQGEYYIAARHPEFASPEPSKLMLVADNEANVVDLVLPTPHVITGTVVLPDGKGCPNVAINYNIQGALYSDTFTQHDGSFRFLVPQAEGVVQVEAPLGYRTAEYFEIPVKGELPDTISLPPVRLVELPLIEGVVMGEEGMPAPNVLVASRNLDLQARAVTNADGGFRLKIMQAPPQGSIQFRAEHAQRFQRVDFEVNVESSQKLEMKLAPFEPDLSPRKLLPTDNDMSKLVDQPAPPLACDAWFNSQPLALESLKGKVVVLAFWAGFDDRPASLDMIDELRAVFDMYRFAGDVAMLGIHDSGSPQSEVEQSIRTCRIAFPVARDAEPGQTFEAYGIRYIPQVVVLDKQGRLRYYQTQGRLLEMIKSLRRE